MAAAKDLRMLLRFACDSLRIPDELAEDIGAEEALVISPAGGKGKVVWRVEVGRDDDGAFLGRGWPELAGACGVGVGWFLILRHRGRGVLTMKAFDDNRCLRDLGALAPPAAMSGKGAAAHRPQFISVIPTDFMEKMILPAKFVQQYILKEHLNNSTAIVLGRHGKVFNIKLEMDQSGMFFTGGWSQFLVFHDITEANALLLRYEGNMVFTVKVFGSDGFQRDCMLKENRVQQRSTLPHSKKLQQAQSLGKKLVYKIGPPSWIKKQINGNTLEKHLGTPKRKKDRSTADGEKRPQGLKARTKCVFQIGPPAWIKKEMNTSTIESHLNLALRFCEAIGLRQRCTIMLKTSNSTKSWQVHLNPYTNCCHLAGRGWKSFCLDNGIKAGDVCTMQIIETTLWNVIIDRREN